MGTDNHAYLLSIVAFVKGGNRFLTPGSLSAACFWVGLRQEIYSAMMSHRTVWINLDNGLVDRSLEPAEDHTWANRAVIHCADVLNFCFGQDAQHATSRWEELDDYSRRWKIAKPSSFEPLYEDKSATRAFPEVWLQSSCHAIGLQHHLLAELFLARFDPKIPKIGANRKVAEEQLTVRTNCSCVRTAPADMSRAETDTEAGQAYSWYRNRQSMGSSRPFHGLHGNSRL